MTESRKAKAAGFAVLLGMLIAGWLFVLSPRGEGVAAVDGEITATAAVNDALRNQIRARRAQEAKLAEWRAVAAALTVRFPPDAQQPRLFRMVTAAAAAAGLAPGAVANLTVGAPVRDAAAGTAAIASQQITMNVTGTPLQIRSLIGNLENLPRAFRLTTVTVASADTEPGGVAGGRQTVTINGQMFVMPTLADPTARESDGRSPG